jgi:hypothetical protein
LAILAKKMSTPPNRTRLPRASTKAWILVVSPPCDLIVPGGSAAIGAMRFAIASRELF